MGKLKDNQSLVTSIQTIDILPFPRLPFTIVSELNGVRMSFCHHRVEVSASRDRAELITAQRTSQGLDNLARITGNLSVESQGHSACTLFGSAVFT